MEVAPVVLVPSAVMPRYNTLVKQGQVCAT
jgi:hypothetical protein